MSEDLAVFKPITLPSELEGTAYFELHIGERSDIYSCWLPGSLCIRDSGFDFICKCFHSASTEFDYFSFIRLESTEINQLIQELSKFIDELSDSPSREVVFSRFASLFSPAMWNESTTQDLAHSVRSLASEVRKYAQQAISLQECLWVLGM